VATAAVLKLKPGVVRADHQRPARECATSRNEVLDNVHCWHKADVGTVFMNARFEGNIRHDTDVTRCLLMTQSGLPGFEPINGAHHELCYGVERSR
jgi:hypothetical protein